MNRFLTFASGSAIGWVIDYIVTLALVNFLNTNPSVALGIAMIISATLIYFYHSHITFKKHKQDSIKRYLLFMGWSGIIFILRAGCMKSLLSFGLPLAVSLIIAMVTISVVNYGFNAVILFSKARS